MVTPAPPRDPSEPDAAEVARIEAAKAAARAEKAKVILAMRTGPHRAEGPPPAALAKPEGAPALGACPKCGKPYGKRRRCHACHPGGKPGRPRKGTTGTLQAREVPPQPTAKGPVPAPSPRPDIARPKAPDRLTIELNAMRAVADILRGLDADLALRVARWAYRALQADAARATG